MFFSCVDRNLAVSIRHPLHTKWLNQPLAFSYRSGNLCLFNRVMKRMFSCVQYKSMEQWSIYFGTGTLHKGPVHVPPL